MGFSLGVWIVVVNWLDKSPVDVWRSLLSSKSCGIFVASLTLEAYWLKESPLLNLAVVFCSTDVDLRSAIVSRDLLDSMLANTSEKITNKDFFDRIVVESGAAIIHPTAAQKLQPVFIPKPWGQEIWYSGIEARGVAGITDGSGVTPLPWLLAAFPELYGDAAPVLLKILDPYADELLGDLYFELHQEKREVYVVTSIDSQAWPDGKGAIRFGFNQVLRKNYLDDKAFTEAFLNAVKAYEVLRRQIDVLLDQCRMADGVLPSDAVSPEQMHRWLSTLPHDLIQQEHTARLLMNSFTHLKPLNLGDIVKVPTLLPHSLQHGVRTVEFQTPVYERMILSFAQKVLTQSHWDTEQALSLMTLEAPEELPPVMLASGQGWQCEQVVEFADFAVERWYVEPGAEFDLVSSATYRLLMVVAGQLQIGECKIDHEEAVLLPALQSTQTLVNNSTKSWIFLLARPK